MTQFDDREKSFEKKFVHDEELQFKIAARRNKYLGQWASKFLGYDLEKENEYIQAVIKSDFAVAGDEDVFRKVKTDLKDHNISEEDIRKTLAKFPTENVEEIIKLFNYLKPQDNEGTPINIDLKHNDKINVRRFPFKQTTTEADIESAVKLKKIKIF